MRPTFVALKPWELYEMNIGSVYSASEVPVVNMRVLLASVLLVTVAFALPVPEDNEPPPHEIVGEYIVTPDKPLVVVVDAEDADLLVTDGGDDSDDDSDSDDSDEVDTGDGAEAITVFCSLYPKALECQDVVILKPSIIDLAAPAVIPPVSSIGEVVQEILPVLPAPAVPVVTQVQQEVDNLAEIVVDEVLTAIPGVSSGLRVKRQSWRGNRPTQVLDTDFDDNPVTTYCAANPTDTACLQFLGIRQTDKKKKKKNKDSSESNSSSSEEDDKGETEDILTTIRRRCTLNPSLPGCRRRDRPSMLQNFDQSSDFLGVQGQGFVTQSGGNVQNGQIGINSGFQQGVQGQGFVTQSGGSVQNGQIGVNQGFQQGVQSQAFATQSLGNSQNGVSVSQSSFSGQRTQ